MASDSDNGGLHDQVKTVTIRTFVSHDTANIACSNLEAHGIECWISSDDGGGVLPYLTIPGGVRLSVHASEAEAAIALLNAETSDHSENEISVPSDSISENKNLFVPIGIGIGIVVLLWLLYILFKRNVHSAISIGHFGL